MTQHAVAVGGIATADGGALRPYVATAHAEWLMTEPDRCWKPVDGTLVFADVSGFTPLTERLARHGRVGAEALTDVLNDVFDALLTGAASYGGDLLKFGGDALLLLFRGDASAERATAVAAGMHTALRRWRRFRTEAGMMSLRMSIGIATGTVHAFLVGGSHRELLVAGPVVTRVVACEAAADAGETVLDHETAIALQPRHVGEARGPGILLRRPASCAPVGAGEIVNDAVDHDVTDGIPVSLRAPLLARADEGEHRQAVLTFVQFRGVDRLLETDGPAVVAEALDDLVRATQQACESHGVTFLATDVDAGGGKILLVAGAPVATTDDADRTLTALLDVVGRPSPLAVRAGVNAGPAFAVDVGSATRRTYAVMGDATNLAARVMGKAPPGGIIATDVALARTNADYDVEALEPFQVKGKSQPVSACRVLGLASEVDHRGGARRQLLGRENEMGVLADLVAAARTGKGGVVELVGDAGIGKSSLVEATRRTAADLPAFAVAAAPYASASPYFAFRAPLRAVLGLPSAPGADDGDRLVGALSGVDPGLLPWAPLLGVVVGVDLPDTAETAQLDSSYRRQRAHETTRELLSSILTDPALITVEDAHWLDEASAALLGDLVAHARTNPWAVIITRRRSDGGFQVAADAAPRLELEPLDATAVLDLARAERDDLPPHVRELLAERSAGNPLFLLELLAATRSAADAATLPDTVESVIATRMDTLQPADRSVIRDASVLGLRFSTDLVGDISGRSTDDVDRALGTLDGFVVRDGDGWQFAHALVRDVAYAGLPFRRRRALHAAAAAGLEARAGQQIEEWADLLSLHHAEAQQHEPTWRYARMAGDRARARWAPADAQVLYRRGLDAARHLDLDPAVTAPVWEALGDVAEVAGAYTDAALAYRRARALRRREPLRVADLCRKEGWVRERSGRYAQALAWYSRGVRAVQECADGEAVLQMQAQLALAAGAARLRQGKYRRGLPLLHHAVALAEQLEDKPTLAHAYYLLDWAHTDLGNADALEYRELSVPIYEALGNHSRLGVVYSNLGIDAYFEGRWDEAIALYERGRDASRRAGDVVQAATAGNNIGEVRSDQGRLDEAELLFRDALATWQAAPFPVGVSLAMSNLGRAATRAGRLDEAAARYEAARAGFSAIGANGYVLEVDAREAERLVFARSSAAALELATRTMAGARQLGGMPTLIVLLRRVEGVAAAQLGERSTARRILEDAVAQAAGTSHMFERALTLDVLGRLVPGDDGRAHRAAASDLLERLGVVFTPHVDLE